MISREREIPFKVGPWYGDVPPRAAYHLEAQAAAVSFAQRDGGLIKERLYFAGLAMVNEMDLRWYQFMDGYRGVSMIICAIDCNEELFGNMRIGTPLDTVHTRVFLPEVFDGKMQQAMAVIFVNDEILYQSRGFNLERYYEEGLLKAQPIRKQRTDRQNPLISALGRLRNFNIRRNK